MNKALILGASGYIGQRLLATFTRMHLAAVGTCCRRTAPGCIHYDLREADADRLLDSQAVDTVIVAAAAHASLDAAKHHWHEAYRVNVTATITFLDACQRRGIVPVYLSSDAVFDGARGDYREMDQRQPVNCYGRMKLEVENFLLHSGRPSLILRAGKVFGLADNDGTLLTRMRRDLDGVAELRYATDHVFTPVWEQDLCGFVAESCRAGRRGVVHVASLPALTFYDLATAMCRRRGLAASRLAPCHINDLGLADRRPLNVGLNTERYRKLSGMELKTMDYFFDRMGI